MKQSGNKIKKEPTIHLIDVLVVLCFGVYSLLFFLSRWDNQKPYIDLSSDMALNVAGSAAALDHPDLLSQDKVLGNPDNFRFYQSIHVPLTRVLARWCGDYGRAVILLLGFHVFLQLCGFYILGRVILKSRLWGLLFAAMTATTVTLSLGEYWGLYSDPQPRFTFQALLPFLLAAAYHWKENRKVWPLLMVAAGLLIYVHSVSALIWAFALWLGFWIYLPKGWSLLTRVLHMVTNGLDFVIVSIPFIWNYLTARTSSEPVNIDNIIHFMETIYPNNFRPWTDMQLMLAILAEDSLLWPGLAGLGILIWLLRKNFRPLGLVLLWIIGIFCVSVVIPTVEISLFQGRSYIAMTPILVRGLRYLVPLIMLFCLWPLAEISRRIMDAKSSQWHATCLNLIKEGVDTRFIHGTLLALGVFIVLAVNVLSDAGYQSGRSLQWRLPVKALSCWMEGRFICPNTAEKTSQLEVLQFVKDLPNGSTILPILIESDKQYSLELAVRYAALQPVVFTDKDFSTYWQSNPALLIQWEKDAQQINQIKNTNDLSQRMKEAQSAGKRLGASYLLLDWNFSENSIPDSGLVYKNDHYSLYIVGPIDL